MNIDITLYGEPPNCDAAQAELDIFNESLTGPHKVIMVWNPSRYTRLKSGRVYHIPRWEVWITLGDNTYRGKRHAISDKDRYLSDKGWIRKLQTFCYRDKGRDVGFAPFDTALVESLRKADAWSDRDLLVKAIERPETERDKRRVKRAKEALLGSQSYYRRWDDLTVGPYVNSGWRHRIR